MTNTKHTPWTAEYIDNHNNNGVKDSEGDYIAIGMMSHHANLFAAAPDLLEALEELLADIIDYQTINNLGGGDNHWQLATQAAIAKARGQ